MIFKRKNIFKRIVFCFVILFLFFTTYFMLISSNKTNHENKHDLDSNVVDDRDKQTTLLEAKSIKTVAEYHRRPKKRTRDRRLGNLHGGPSNCQLYRPDGNPSESTAFECISLEIDPSPRVCLHPLEADKHISFSLAKESTWEGRTLEVFKQILLSDAGLGVYDVGANVGIYSLLAAAMGHKVVAVEPHEPNLRRLHRAIEINGVEKNVVLLRNAVSNRRGTYALEVPHDNQGGAHLTPLDADRFCGPPEPCPPRASSVLLDDLLEVTNFERAVIKIDVEGHEHRALRASERLFRGVEVTHVLMEWQKLRSYHGSLSEENRDKSLVEEMIETLRRRSFCPFDVLTRKLLSPHHWYGWPDDVIWIHSGRSLHGFPDCK